jgi:hypothetical protein
LLYNLAVKEKIIGCFIVCETIYLSGNDIEKVVKMMQQNEKKA